MANKLSLTEIKDIIKNKDVICGTKQTLASLKEGKVGKIILSSSCPEGAAADIERYAAMNNTEIIKADFPNEELGVICKKPFSISVLSTMK